MSASQLGSSGAARLDYQPLFWTNKPAIIPLIESDQRLYSGDGRNRA